MILSLADKGQPNEVVKSIVPKFNQFLFFEVTPVSFHQVNAVLILFGYFLCIHCHGNKMSFNPSNINI